MLRALLCTLLALGLLSAADSTRSTFVTAKVSAKIVSLNQVVRVEFTTMPRQVEGIDVKVTVQRALDAARLAGLWRALGEPVVSEHEKTRTITVSFAVLPRKVGDSPLPKVPLTWLTGEQVAEFGTVTVAPQLQVGSDTRDLPKEVSGVAGFLWGERLVDAKAKLGGAPLVERDGATVATLQPGLQLIFRGGSLAEATLTVTDLDLARAKDSFLGRWGPPQLETPAMITWILGWTRITATPGADGAGTVLTLVREDVQAALDQDTVSRRVFGVLDAPAPAVATPESRKADAEQEAQRLLDQQKKP
jgi:hypothetical protein